MRRDFTVYLKLAWKSLKSPKLVLSSGQSFCLSISSAGIKPSFPWPVTGVCTGELSGMALQDTHQQPTTLSLVWGVSTWPVSLCLKANGTEVLEQQLTCVETLELSPCVGGGGLEIRKQDKEKVPRNSNLYLASAWSMAVLGTSGYHPNPNLWLVSQNSSIVLSWLSHKALPGTTDTPLSAIL